MVKEVTFEQSCKWEASLVKISECNSRGKQPVWRRSACFVQYALWIKGWLLAVLIKAWKLVKRLGQLVNWMRWDGDLDKGPFQQLRWFWICFWGRASRLMDWLCVGWERKWESCSKLSGTFGLSSSEDGVTIPWDRETESRTGLTGTS